MTPTNIAEYLIDRGLISVSSVVDGDLVVADMSRRNRNFSVAHRSGCKLFVKQAKLEEPEAIETIAREAWLYRLIDGDPRCQALRDFVPRSRLYDPQRHIHVLDWVDGDNLGERLRQGHAAPDVAGRLGEVLAIAHSCVGAAASGASPGGPLRGQVPWILTFHHRAGAMPSISPANAALAKWIGSRPEIGDSLDAVRMNWRHDALMHGDLKLDNCLGSARPGDGQAVTIVDWELGDGGDGAWDVGTVLQGYVSQAIFENHAPGAGGTRSPSLTALARLRPALNAFWSAYAERRGLYHRVHRYRELIRTVIWSGARMIQTAYECLVFEHAISAPAAALVETAAWLMWQPEPAARLIFGGETS